MAEDSIKANIGNYKGVMLCARPNENIMLPKDKPFISRVDPKENLGINPVRKVHQTVRVPRVNPALKRHKEWLENFKEQIRRKKEDEEEKEIREKEKYGKLRDIATFQREKLKDNQNDIENVKENPNMTSVNKLNESTDNAKPITLKGLTDQNLKKLEEANKSINEKENGQKNKTKKEKAKPKWAMTEKELQEKEDAEVEDLLNFADNLNYDKYIGDLEVKNMLAAIKKRIDDLKQEEDWRAKIVDQWNEEDKKTREERKAMKLQKAAIDLDNASDARSMASEGGKSAASEKTHKSIQSIKEQMEKKEQNKQDDWDRTTNAEKKQVSLEDRLAKHIADEILRNNTNIRMIHSNTSIRKILEKEARKQIENPTSIPLPKIVQNKEYAPRYEERDPSNLPYLHRNPAV